MTISRSIYMQVADAGNPTQWELFDYNNHAKINTVTSMQVTVDVLNNTIADLRHSDGSSERVEVLPIPPGMARTSCGLPAGTQLVSLELSRDQMPNMDEIFTMKARRFEVDANSVIHSIDALDYAHHYAMQAVTLHGQQVSAANAAMDAGLDILMENVGRNMLRSLRLSNPVLGRTMPTDRSFLLGGTEILRGGPVPSPFAVTSPSALRSGGAVPRNRWTTPIHNPAPAPVKVCDECAGTGEYVCPVSNKRSPCSKGCKAP